MNNQKQLPVLFILQAKNDLHLSKTEHTLMLNGVRFLKPDLIIFLKSLPSAPEGILTNPMDVFCLYRTATFSNELGSISLNII